MSSPWAAALAVCGAILVFAGTAALTGCGGGGGGTPSASTPELLTLQRPAANHNRVVGYSRGEGTLPDGTPFVLELSALPDSRAQGLITIHGKQAIFGNSPYDMRNGFGGWRLPVPGGFLDGNGYPVQSGTIIPVFNDGSMTMPRVEVRMIRENAPLGGDNAFSLSDLSADCSATPSGGIFSYLETKHNIPLTKSGDFSANGALSDSGGANPGGRSFSLFIFDIPRNFSASEIRLGNRIPVVTPGGDPVTRIGYFEVGADGKVRQWFAISGTVVFDAVQADGADASYGGDVYQTGSTVTFHFENVRMEAKNPPGDDRFAGAAGTFTFNFSGTSTVPLNKFSR